MADDGYYTGDDGAGNEALDAMRKLLEVSWNADTMGELPKTSKAAANEAYATISSGTENGLSLFLIDNH